MIEDEPEEDDPEEEDQWADAFPDEEEEEDDLHGPAPEPLFEYSPVPVLSETFLEFFLDPDKETLENPYTYMDWVDDRDDRNNIVHLRQILRSYIMALLETPDNPAPVTDANTLYFTSAFFIHPLDDQELSPLLKNNSFRLSAAQLSLAEAAALVARIRPSASIKRDVHFVASTLVKKLYLSLVGDLGQLEIRAGRYSNRLRLVREVFKHLQMYDTELQKRNYEMKELYKELGIRQASVISSLYKSIYPQGMLTIPLRTGTPIGIVPRPAQLLPVDLRPYETYLPLRPLPVFETQSATGRPAVGSRRTSARRATPAGRPTPVRNPVRVLPPSALVWNSLTRLRDLKPLLLNLLPSYFGATRPVSHVALVSISSLDLAIPRRPFGMHRSFVSLDALLRFGREEPVVPAAVAPAAALPSHDALLAEDIPLRSLKTVAALPLESALLELQEPLPVASAQVGPSTSFLMEGIDYWVDEEPELEEETEDVAMGEPSDVPPSADDLQVLHQTTKEEEEEE